jgi:hypothetical protein
MSTKQNLCELVFHPEPHYGQSGIDCCAFIKRSSSSPWFEGLLIPTTQDFFYIVF